MAKTAYLGLKIVVLCLLWYITSAANNVIGKLVLQSFAYPTTITLFQFLSISIYSIPALRCIPGAKRKPMITWTYYFKLIIPLSFGKFFASLTSHISLWAVPVSYAHTVKASMPLFVVVLSRVILGEKQTTKVYFSLIPIILGVFIASITELEFNVIGLVAALFSIFIFSLQNIYSKKVLKETPIHHLRLLYILAKHALIMFIPYWAYQDLPSIIYGEKNSTIDGWAIGSLLFMDGLCNFLQNVIAFTMLSLVTPLTYSVCNASKRIAVISCSILLLKNPVTWTNIFGMSLAIFGVFYYNKAKLDARNEPILPTTSKPIEAIRDFQSTIKKKSSDTNLLLRYIDTNEQEKYFTKPIVTAINNHHHYNQKQSSNYYNGNSLIKHHHRNVSHDDGDHRRIDMMHI
ncbi:solute carrier family 35 member E1 homolog [Dermatophagoides pteronyssinus]|uniref:solute carrier family 35 member E1 homolog n=1 Tax=Dermatophagoides pteronyssinus TaxID=6956 RepID=UPI003F670349